MLEGYVSTDRMDGHERLCSERYSGIRKDISEIKRIGGWAGAGAITIIVAMLGWSLKQGYDREQTFLDELHKSTAAVVTTVQTTHRSSEGQTQ